MVTAYLDFDRKKIMVKYRYLGNLHESLDINPSSLDFLQERYSSWLKNHFFQVPKKCVIDVSLILHLFDSFPTFDLWKFSRFRVFGSFINMRYRYAKNRKKILKMPCLPLQFSRSLREANSSQQLVLLTC